MIENRKLSDREREREKMHGDMSAKRRSVDDISSCAAAAADAA